MEKRGESEVLASADILHRRGSDPSGADFRKLRYAEERQVIMARGVDNSLQKWTVAAVLSIALALFGFFAGRDRLSVDAKFNSLDQKQEFLSTSVARHEAEIQVIRAKQDRMLADIAEASRKTDDVSRKLDMMLMELRKR